MTLGSFYLRFGIQPDDKLEETHNAHHFLKKHNFWISLSLVSLWSFVFSLMSTFNFRFKEWEFGRWIKMLWIEEYDFKVTGIIRFVSGVQALVCLTLLFTVFLSLFSNYFYV